VKALTRDDSLPRDVRGQIRRGEIKGPTTACCPGYVQANLVILPERLASDFLLFCQRNPGPCPLLEVTAPGDFEAKATAPGSDLRVDVPRYRIYRNGRLDIEREDLLDLWEDDWVSFLLGCSFTFDTALERAGVPARHLEERKNVSMYATTRPCEPVGRFSGPLVVTMRPIPAELVSRAAAVTSEFPLAHGAPVHLGDPAALGIEDLGRPDFGDAVSIREGEVPVFWACGVTPQAVAMKARPELMVTHSPGHMFVTDLTLEDLRVIPEDRRFLPAVP
jgi:uncharacterized protein YcsI (UPF0317 family)